MDPSWTREDQPSPTKAQLRRELLARRRRRSDPGAAGLAAAAGGRSILQQASTVTAYAALPGEPDPGKLVQALLARGVRVLLPVLLLDRDLDWTEPGPFGRLLGRDAVAEADVVLVPGLAAGPDGTRLGRGGGSYDRALTRAAPHAWVVVLLHPDELLPYVPREAHDVPVHAALTVGGLSVFRPPIG